MRDMSNTMHIHSRLCDYSVEISLETLTFLDPYDGEKSLFYVVDHNVYALYPHLFSSLKPEEMFVFEAIEKNKTVEYAMLLCEALLQRNVGRNTTLIVVGGGIVQDRDLHRR